MRASRTGVVAVMSISLALPVSAGAMAQPETSADGRGAHAPRPMAQLAGLNAETAEQAPGALFWQAIKDSQDPALFEAYLKRSRRGQFDGRHTDAAAARLRALRGDNAPDDDDGTSPDTSKPGGFAQMTVARTVMVHAKPAFDAEAMGKLAAGDTVKARIANVDGPWHKIVLESGKTGYVMEDPFAEGARFE